MIANNNSYIPQLVPFHVLEHLSILQISELQHMNILPLVVASNSPIKFHRKLSYNQPQEL